MHAGCANRAQYPMCGATLGTVTLALEWELIPASVGFAVRATPQATDNIGVFQMMYAVTGTGFGPDKDQAIAVAFLIQTQQISGG